MTLKQPFVLWFTGFPSSGKTTLAKALVATLADAGVAVEHLDGDVVRGILPRIGFDADSRNAHVRQMGFVASRLGTIWYPYNSLFCFSI